jgi:hypothetical protein
VRRSIVNRVAAAVAAGALTVTLAACGDETSDDTNPGDETTQTGDSDDDDDQDDDQDDDDQDDDDQDDDDN